MIGVIQGDKIFEFMDESQLANDLDWYADKYSCKTLFIVDASDRIKGIVHNGDFTWMPNLNEDTKYYLYGNPNDNGADLQRNDDLPRQSDWELGYIPFAFTVQRVPKTLELY